MPYHFQNLPMLGIHSIHSLLGESKKAIAEVLEIALQEVTVTHGPLLRSTLVYGKEHIFVKPVTGDSGFRDLSMADERPKIVWAVDISREPARCANDGDGLLAI